MEEKNPIQVSERIFHTIECLARTGPIGLLELSKELNLNKSTVHRILNSLICMEYAKQDAETLKYSLTFKFCGIANQILAQNNIIDLIRPYIKELAEQTNETVKQDAETLKYSLTFKFCGIANQILAQNNIIDLIRPYIKELAEQTNETVHLVQLDGLNAVYIDKVEASHNSVRQNNIIDLIRPYIKELAEQTNETVHLVQLDGLNAVYIDKVEASHNSVRLVSMVGKSIPLYCSGVGKALLADMSDEKIQKIWDRSEIKKLTDYTVIDFPEFQKLIAEVRTNGYAMDNEENELGVRCIAVSLKGLHRKPAYAISVSAPKDRMDDARVEQFTHLILDAKQRIQNELGN